jgi:CDP-ribitol ribitolphosphotransferase
MKKQPINIYDLLKIDNEYSIDVEEIEWERIQVKISGTISAKHEDKIGKIDMDTSYFLYSPYLDKYIKCKHSNTCDGRFNLRINIMSIDDLTPLFKGSWYIFAEIEGRKVCFGTSNSVIQKIDTFTRIFNYGGSRYIARPTLTSEDRFFLIEVLLYGFRLKPKKSLKNIKTQIRLNFFRILIQIIQLFVKRSGKRIMFTSDSRQEISGNEKCIYDRLIERGLDKEYTILTSFKSNIKDYRRFTDKFQIAYNLAVADYIFVDDYQPIIYNTPFSPGTEVIQLWHAFGSFKTVGYSRIGKPGGPNPFKSNHKVYTKVIVGSEHDIYYYAEAFGVDESTVIPTGVPKMDAFFDEANKEEVRNNFYEKYPTLKGKEIIMFAPTFRGHGAGTAFYDFQFIDFAALAKLCRERNAVTIFKMHPFVIEKCPIPKEFSDVCVDLSKYREINDILIVADLLITDYSSVIFEYSTLNRPMLFFAYDLENYVSERDFYEEFTGFVPGRIVKTFDEVLDTIQSGEFEVEKVEKFKRKHFNSFDSGSTDRIIDSIILKKGYSTNP